MDRLQHSRQVIPQYHDFVFCFLYCDSNKILLLL